MASTAPTAEQIRLIVAHFKECADEATDEDFRALMLNTVAELEAIAAKIDAGEPIDPSADRAA